VKIIIKVKGYWPSLLRSLEGEFPPYIKLAGGFSLQWDHGVAREIHQYRNTYNQKTNKVN